MVTRRGVGAVGCLFYLVLLGCIVYFGSPYGSAYLKYYRFRDAMNQEAEFSAKRTDIAIQSRLRSFADSIGLPATASMVNVQRTPKRVRISSSYSETITIPVIGERKVRFNPQVEASF